MTATFWLAWLDGKLAGYLKLMLDTHTESIQSGKTLQVERIYVEPAMQGRGIGESFMDFVSLQAQQAQAELIWLSVWKKNPRAVKFYERCGYEICGTEIFQLGDDAQLDWVMRKQVV